MDIIFFCFTEKWWDWARDGFAGRTAALAYGMAKHPAVRRMLVVNAPSSALRALARRRPPGAGHVRGLRWLSDADDSVFVIDQTRLLPRDRHHPVAFAVNGLLHDHALGRRIREAARYLGMKTPVVWLSGPVVAKYSGVIEGATIVYDAVDEWLEHPDWVAMRGAIRQGYGTILESSDLVFAVTQRLADSFALGGARVSVLPNGSGHAHLVQAARPDSTLDRLPHPRVGYLGVIQDRLDVGTVERLARAMPDVQFVFVGPVANARHIAPVRGLPNVHFPGPCAPDAVPSCLAAFDVCILPHVDSELTRNMDPVKLYEYVASGKPVVASALPSITHSESLVRRARSDAEWVFHLRDAISGRWKPDPEDTSSFVAASSWSARTDEAIQQVANVVKVERSAAVGRDVNRSWCQT